MKNALMLLGPLLMFSACNSQQITWEPHPHTLAMQKECKAKIKDDCGFAIDEHGVKTYFDQVEIQQLIGIPISNLQDLVDELNREGLKDQAIILKKNINKYSHGPIPKR